MLFTIVSTLLTVFTASLQYNNRRMKRLPVVCLLFIVFDTFSQTLPDSTIIFSGYVFDSDSIPVEGVYLLNCRTLMAVSTDSSGHFRTRVQPGDSLVTNHISYKRMFIHGNEKSAAENIFFLSIRPYEISPVIVKSYEVDLANFEKNMQFIYKQIGLMKKPTDYKTSYGPQTANPYAPGASTPGFGFNLLDLFPGKKRR